MTTFDIAPGEVVYFMSKSVSLFIPCLVDQVMPEVGVAMVRLLRHAGFEVSYNPDQTCCGQPGFNAGHRDEARKVACHCLDAFKDAACIVSPSGSCAAMMRKYYRELFEGHSRQQEAVAHGKRVFELSEFLAKEGKLEAFKGSFSGKVGVHTSCHTLRELGISEEPMALIRQIDCDIVEPETPPVCCGFGGMFYVKYAPVAKSMGRSRLLTFAELGAKTVVVNDPGCIMHMRQSEEREKLGLEILHTTEFLHQAVFGERAK